MRWTLLTIIAFSLSSVLIASEEKLSFSTIRLSQSFQELLNQETRFLKSQTAGTQNIDGLLIPALFGKDWVSRPSSAYRAQILKSGSPSDGQDSLLYREIRQWLEGRYQTIGQTEVQNLQWLNQQFGLNNLNFSGFTWQKPFGGFSLSVNRQLSPDLFNANRWIVMDTFTILFEASHFLGKLNEAGVVDMSAAEIAGFAGINFKRVFTSYHYASSFSQGLVSDFRPLFLPFLQFRPEALPELVSGQVLKREDTWSIGAGGLIESPPWYGLSFRAGILAEATHESTLSIQRMGAEAPQELVRVAHQVNVKKRAGVSAAMQLDFFKLIKFTLLSQDLEYEAEKSHEVTLSFRPEHRELLISENPKSTELRSLLKRGATELRELEPFVVKLDHTEGNSQSQRTMLLLHGRLKSSNFQQIRVVKDQVVKTFFKSYSESIKLVQNFWSRLFSSVIFRLFEFATLIQNDAAFTKRVQLEYEATLPQSSDPKLMQIETSEQFSMTALLSYEAARTHKWTDRSYRKDAENFLERFTNLSPDFRGMIRNHELRGPLNVTTHVRIMGEGLDYFHSLPDQDVAAEFHYLCQGKASCLKALQRPYESYRKAWSEHRRMELVHLKQMMELVLKHLHDLRSLQVLFGESVFIHGSFRATSSGGLMFSTTFSSGDFRGLGVIDNYQRLHGTRQPASVWE
jgi:hypothetical protein